MDFWGVKIGLGDEGVKVALMERFLGKAAEQEDEAPAAIADDIFFLCQNKPQ